MIRKSVLNPICQFHIGVDNQPGDVVKKAPLGNATLTVEAVV
jgi:hypothetical protein